MKILIACEFSGRVRDAFLKRGHDAISCDLLPTESPGPHYQGDVRDILNDGWDLMIAHPECTYLTVTANKWHLPKYKERFPDREQKRKEAISFFLELANTDIPQICLENPVGIMSSRFRKPDQIIQPCMFGHPIRKTTCLWLKNLPQLIPTKIVSPELDKFPSGNCQSKWHTETGHIKDKKERSKTRSRTFMGIAEAMADQWGNNEYLKRTLVQQTICNYI
jgi:hypothetical protein